MGYEIEKVYVLLKKYENDIKESNAKLKKLYEGNLEYYKQLEKAAYKGGFFALQTLLYSW